MIFALSLSLFAPAAADQLVEKQRKKRRGEVRDAAAGDLGTGVREELPFPLSVSGSFLRLLDEGVFSLARRELRKCTKQQRHRKKGARASSFTFSHSRTCQEKTDRYAHTHIWVQKSQQTECSQCFFFKQCVHDHPIGRDRIKQMIHRDCVSSPPLQVPREKWRARSYIGTTSATRVSVLFIFDWALMMFVFFVSEAEL